MKPKDLAKSLLKCPYKAETEKEEPQFCKKYQCLCFPHVREEKCERMNKIIKEYFES